MFNRMKLLFWGTVVLTLILATTSPSQLRANASSEQTNNTVSKTEDVTKPSLTKLSFPNEKRVFTHEDTLELLATVEGGPSSIKEITARFKNKDSYQSITLLYSNQSEPATNVYKLQLSINKYQKNGVYTLENLTITDREGNMQYYTPHTMDFSDISFEIDNELQDSKAPTVSELAFPNEKRVFKQGDNVVLHVTAEDDVSGIYQIKADFINKESNDRFSVFFPTVTEPVVNNTHNLRNRITNQKNGVYTLNTITIIDNARNGMIYSSDMIDFSDMSIEIAKDTQDSKPPSLSALAFPNEKRVFKQGDNLEINATIEDDVSGVSEVTAYFKNKETNKIFFVSYRFDGPNGNVYKLQAPIHEYQKNGIYALERVSIYDNAGNSIDYTPDMMDFSEMSFEVRDNVDVTPPGNGGTEQPPGNGGTEQPPTGGGGSTTSPPADGGSGQTPPPTPTTPQKPFVIKGVENNGYYSKDISVEFENGTITLDGKFYSSGTPITVEGKHTLSITTLTGEKSEIKFVLDKTAPEVSLVSSNKKSTNQDIYIHVKSIDITTDIKSISLPDGKVKTGSTISYKIKQNGTYTFEVTDLANNKTTKNIKISNIDKKVPNAPTVKTVSTTRLIGKGEKNTNVYLLKGKTVLAKSSVSKNGTFKISFKKQNKNTALSLYLIDVAGNKSKYKQIKIN